MYKSVLFNIVKKRIDEYDLESFLGLGAPENEYDNESRRIADKIKELSTVEEIAEIISKEFMKSFDSEIKPENCLEVAGLIKKDMEEYSNEYHFREIICPYCEHRFMMRREQEGIILEGVNDRYEDTICPKCGKWLTVKEHVLMGKRSRMNDED